MTLSKSVIRISFYFLWLVIQLLQASNTELLGDEAYYWKYSQHLAWGYFDHPPMIALFIKVAYLVFKNELGVRLISLISSSLFIFIIEKIIKPNDLKLFYSIIISIGLIHFFGFLALPESPFFLFLAIYFLILKEFLARPNLTISLLLSIIIAFMLYSKYHGFLVIALTVLSNLSFFRSKYFYLVFICSLILLLPHFYWQYENGFPSFKYHLFERSEGSYDYLSTLEFMVTQPLVYGPFTSIFIIWSVIKANVISRFEKTMYFIFWSGLLFFFLMTFKGRVEAHWTSFIVIPSIFFTYIFLQNTKRARRIFYNLLPFALGLIILMRVLIAFDLNIGSLLLISQFHNNKKMAQLVENVAEERTVAFVSSYQKPSLYSFYTGKNSFAYNSLFGRSNQYDFWDYVDSAMYKSIVFIPDYVERNLELITSGKDTLSYRIQDNFVIYNNIQIEAVNFPEIGLIGDTVETILKLSTKSDISIDLEYNPNLKPFLSYQVRSSNSLVIDQNLLLLKNDMIGNDLKVNIKLPDKPGKYYVNFSVRSGYFYPSRNSPVYTVLTQ